MFATAFTMAVMSKNTIKTFMLLAALAVTQGILGICDWEALRGVLPRDQPRRQPRHPQRLGGGRGRDGHHLRRPHRDVGCDLRWWPRPRRQLQPDRAAGPRDPGA